MRQFSKLIFTIVTALLVILVFIAYWGAFAEDEGTLNGSTILILLSKVFNILRFPTHTLFWSLFSLNATLYLLGLLINCMFYGLLIERLIHFYRIGKR